MKTQTHAPAKVLYDSTIANTQVDSHAMNTTVYSDQTKGTFRMATPQFTYRRRKRQLPKYVLTTERYLVLLGLMPPRPGVPFEYTRRGEGESRMDKKEGLQ